MLQASPFVQSLRSSRNKENDVSNVRRNILATNTTPVPVKRSKKYETLPKSFAVPEKDELHADNAIVEGSKSTASTETVKVAVRCRPLDPSSEQVAASIIKASAGEKTISVGPHCFTFDEVFVGTCTQDFVFENAAKPVIDMTLKGFNASVLAYGQTSSGKTYTMLGNLDNKECWGIIPRVVEHVFTKAPEICNAPPTSAQDPTTTDITIAVSYLEIYNEKVIDLLVEEPVADKSSCKATPGKANKGLDVRETVQGFVVPDLTKQTVMTQAELMACILRGSRNRTTAMTLQNEASSRSHSIISLEIERTDTAAGLTPLVTSSKLNLVDLAGSERFQEQNDVIHKETKSINQSLHTLARVIAALTCNQGDGGQEHVPYRDSKLTRLLKDSLGGNSFTVMIACAYGTESNYHETLSTLRYAQRAKMIRNKPQVNHYGANVLTQRLYEEIQHLQTMLRMRGTVQLRMLMLLKEFSNEMHPSIMSPDGGVSKFIDGAIDCPLTPVSGQRLNKFQETIFALKESMYQADKLAIAAANDDDSRQAMMRQQKLLEKLMSQLQLDKQLIVQKTEENCHLRAELASLSAVTSGTNGPSNQDEPSTVTMSADDLIQVSIAVNPVISRPDMRDAATEYEPFKNDDGTLRVSQIVTMFELEKRWCQEDRNTLTPHRAGVRPTMSPTRSPAPSIQTNGATPNLRIDASSSDAAQPKKRIVSATPNKVKFATIQFELARCLTKGNASSVIASPNPKASHSEAEKVTDTLLDDTFGRKRAVSLAPHAERAASVEYVTLEQIAMSKRALASTAASEIENLRHELKEQSAKLADYERVIANAAQSKDLKQRKNDKCLVM